MNLKIRIGTIFFIGISFIFIGCANKKIIAAKKWEHPTVTLHNNLSQAPVLGLYQHRTINIRLQTKSATPLSIQYRLAADESMLTTEQITPLKEQNFSTHLMLINLEPNRAYDYRVIFSNGTPKSAQM